MRRKTFVLIALLLWLIPCLSCFAAEEDLYCVYVPKTQTGTLFYIDVYSNRAVAAALMELSYDADFVEYRSVSAVRDTSAARGNNDDGLIKLAFADNTAVSGKLYRMTFKALRTGSTTVKLHMTQAVDDELEYLDGFTDYTLKITFNSKDVSSDSSDKKSSSSKSSKSYETGRSVGGDDNEIYPEGMRIFDLRSDNSWKYAAVGAGAVIIIAAAVCFGVMIGKRRKISGTEPDGKTEDKTASTDDAPEDSDE